MKIGIISGHKISDLNKKPEELIVETNFGDVQILLTKFTDYFLNPMTFTDNRDTAS